MSKNIIISESKLISLIKMVINEDPYVKTNYPHTHAKKKEGDELFPEILKYYLETGSTVKELSQKFNLPYHTINTRLTKYFKELSLPVAITASIFFIGPIENSIFSFNSGQN